MLTFSPNELEVLREPKYAFNATLNRNINEDAYLSIVVTNRCNRNCSYCINSLTDGISDLPISKALENIRKLKKIQDVKEVVLLGGEPTLHKDICSLISGLHDIGFRKIIMTTNAVFYLSNKEYFSFITSLFDAGLTNLNISWHGEDNFLPYKDLKSLARTCKRISSSSKIRVNSNIYKDNLDTIDKISDHILKLSNIEIDEIRLSNLIHKDSFSVNSENKAQDIILPIDTYFDIFNNIRWYYDQYMQIRNKNTLGFMNYTLIGSNPVIILNQNIDSKVSCQCENSNNINIFKCLVTGDISLSWNKNNIIEL